MSDPAPELDLVPTPEAAAIIGVPENEFTRLVDVLHLEPARHGTATTPRMWHRSVVEHLRDGPEGVELRETVARKARLADAYAALEQQYAPWRAALLPASMAMFQFNRWIKHATFSQLRQRELYDLKNRLIELLYQVGLCKELLLHTATLDMEDDEDAAEARQPREFLAFTFEIDGQEFEWHQPRKAVSFKYELTPPLPRSTPRREWQPAQGPKRVTLTSEEFFAAEALIRFVLRKRDQEKEQERRAESQRRREQMRAEGLARQAELHRQREEEGEPGT
jgi:hypothetical protein